ncbi:MAG: outer membrane beta-barrel family protein [Mucilaginibacter sp.]
MKKIILLLIIYLAINLVVKAQTQPNTDNGKITGVILNEKSEPIGFTTMLLLRSQDSTVVKSLLSNDNGAFVFDKLAGGTYILSATYTGYHKYYSSKITLSADSQTITLPPISLAIINRDLQSVTITAQKPLIEMQGDKLVMNVQSSIAATGNTVFELLQKAPGVSIDQSDNIMLNGKSGIMIYMDGKQTYMSQSDLTNLLKNMRSDQIDKLEIISNPSARYDAAGKAIINIVSIKNKNFGTNGSISAGTGAMFGPTVAITETNGALGYKKLGLSPRYNTSLSLNNREGKVNVFGNANFSNTRGTTNAASVNMLGNSVYNLYNYRVTATHNLNYKAGVDFFSDKNTTMGILISGNDGHFENPSPSVINDYIKSPDGILQSSLKTNSTVEYAWANTTFNANFKHIFDTTGRELTIDIDHSIYNNRGYEHGLNTLFFDANGQENAAPLHITNDIPNIYHITAGKLDYSIPIKNKAKLELGAKSSWVTSDNDFKYFKNDAVDPGRTNHFIYTENIDALYGTFNKEFSPKWTLQAGLRVEYTKADGNSITLNQNKSHEYVNLFPSVFLKQVIDKNNEISYSFSRRVDRPAYSKLNPYFSFADPYSYELGNENLQPSFTNSFGINYTLKHSIIFSLGYSATNDVMAQVYKNAIDDPATYAKIVASTAGTNVDPSKVTYVTTENLATQNVLNLGVTFPVILTNWWTANNSFSVQHVKYYGNVSNSLLDYNVVPYNFYSSQVFKLPKKISLEASINYNSKNIYGQIKVKPQYAVNFGVRKSLWDGKANLSLSANDIFATNNFYGTVNTTGVNNISSNKSTSRSVAISFSYKFGNTNVKSARSRSTAASDERNRAN